MDKVKQSKKLILKLYIWLFAILFIIIAGAFCLQYFILKKPIVEESWTWEIIKWVAGYLALAVICGGIAYTPFMMCVYRKKDGLIK